jgi:peptidoglycan hydrolase-like protein with peptidoglycan-binding domain
MILSFQKDHGIIKAASDDGAWVYGPRTRSTLQSAHTQYIGLRDAELQKIEAEKALLISARDEWENNYQVATRKVSTIGSPKRGESGNHIASLQSTLKTKGFYKGKSTGIMSGTTILAIKSLQKSYGLKQTGIIDVFTKEALVEIMTGSV